MAFDGHNINNLTPASGGKLRTFSTSRAKGLALYVKRDRKEWHLRYTRPDGRRNTLKLGEWPSMDEDAAVAATLQQRDLLKHGIDPAEHARGAKRRDARDQFLKGQAVDARYRLSAVAADFLHHAEGRLRASTVTKYRNGVVVHLLPLMGAVDVRFVNVPEFEAACRKLADRSNASAANLLATTRAILSYAVEHNLIQANPLRGRRTLIRTVTPTPRDRFLSSAELHRFLNELPVQPISDDAN